VRTAGPRLQVSAQLIDAHDGATLWANAFDRKLADVFELQDELTRRIVGQLHPELIVADLNYGRVTDNYTSWRRIADAMLQYGHSPDPQHIEDLEEIVADTLRAQSLFQLGGALFQARRFAEAREVLDENLRLQSDNTWAWLLYAASSPHLDDMAAVAEGIERIKHLSGWGVAQFKLLLERILADVWEEGSEVRKLWEETLDALHEVGL